MARQQISILIRALVLATLLVSSSAVAQDGEPRSPASPTEVLGTGFTYQGQLDQNGTPVSDICFMNFELYDAASMGSQVGSTINMGVPIVDGLFTVTLDFGAGTFDGDRRWLGIEVDCDGGGTYADLGRQELTAAPQALYAMGAPWSGLTGVPTGFADGVDNDTTYTAGDGLVLDGTEFSAQGSSYANVVIVAKSGGDYSSVQAAIDSITDAAETNPYLVWVAPGVYSETVMMKPYVNLQGAGQEATVINSTVVGSGWPPSQATLVLTQSVSLRDLTVGNGGTGSLIVALMATAGTTQTLVADVTAWVQGSSTYNYAILLVGNTGVTLQYVTGLAENAGAGASNYGLRNDSGAAVVLHGGSYTGRGGSYAYGIYNFGFTTLEATGVTVLGENGTNTNYGLYNYSAEATLHGGSFTGRGGTNARGIYNTVSGTLEVTSVAALGESGSSTNYSLYQDSGTVYLGVTQLDGGAHRSGGMLTCFQVYDSSFNSYSCP